MTTDQIIILIVESYLLITILSWIYLLFRRKVVEIKISTIILNYCGLPLWMIFHDISTMDSPIIHELDATFLMECMFLVFLAYWFIWELTKDKSRRIYFGIHENEFLKIIRGASKKNIITYDEATYEIFLNNNPKEVYHTEAFMIYAATVLLKPEDQQTKNDPFDIVKYIKEPIENTSMNWAARIVLILAISFSAAMLYMLMRLSETPLSL